MALFMKNSLRGKIRLSMMVFILLAATAGLLTLAANSSAKKTGETTTFNFKDPKGVNTIVFINNSDLEPFGGLAGGVTGEISYDPANPKSFQGEISLDATTLRTGHSKMTEYLHSDQWVKTEANPKITYTFAKVTKSKPGKNGAVNLRVEGKLSLAGISLDKKVEINVSHLPDRAKARGGAKTGDLLVLKSEFTIDRIDFGIKPDMGPKKVNHELRIIANIVGYSK